MPSIAMMLIAWGLIAPLGVYGWQKVSAALDKRQAVSAAVKLTKAAEQQQCAVRIDSIAKELNDDAAKRVAEARSAVAALPPTPDDDAGLRRLCQQSASCRDRSGQ